MGIFIALFLWSTKSACDPIVRVLITDILRYFWKTSAQYIHITVHCKTGRNTVFKWHFNFFIPNLVIKTKSMWNNALIHMQYDIILRCNNLSFSFYQKVFLCLFVPRKDFRRMFMHRSHCGNLPYAVTIK